MSIELLLGEMTVVFGFAVFILLLGSLLRYLKEGVFNAAILILMGSTLLLLPVITFENILFLDLNFNYFRFSYSLTLMRVTFILGILGYLVYNFHLLVVDDLPGFPISVLSVLTGFAIGAMVVSSGLDVSNRAAPIYYHPISGGVFFISSLMVFNLIGAAGFYSYLLRFKLAKVALIEHLSISFFFISPTIIFSLRILHIGGVPFNFIFFFPALSFCFHLGHYTVNPAHAGYATKAEVVSVYLINLDEETLIAGYSKHVSETETKLAGMAFIAVDSVIDEITRIQGLGDRPALEGSYGNILLTQRENLLMVTSFVNGGRKLGKFSQKLLLDKLWKSHKNRNLDHGLFHRYLNCYFNPFSHKKQLFRFDRVFVHTPF